MSEPLLFYSFFPLGFHNVEAERKALAFREGGYDVLYVMAPLIRNPGLTDAKKIATFLRRRRADRGQAVPGDPHALRSLTLAVAPPRQVPLVRRLNGRWVAAQLRKRLAPGRPVAWIRWPTPEVVEALGHLNPVAVVYEVVDSYWETPGIRGRWEAVYERAESELARRADLVVATNESIANRFRPLRADVRLLPHGVDPFPERPWRPAAERAVLGFVGTLDYRLDIPILRALAEHRPEWSIRLIGPQREGFEPDQLADLANVSIEPAVPHARLPDVLAEFDLGLMPYFDHPVFTHMSPVKNLELLAAGKPAVARWSPALAPFGEHVLFAETPEEFVAQVERALAEDSPERAAARRAVAAEHTWEQRFAEMHALVAEAKALRAGTSRL